MPRDSITYPREVPATLYVRLATGEEWEAGEADIAKFAKPAIEQAYFRFVVGLSDALLANGVDLGHKDDLSTSPLNAIRYLAETTIYFGWEATEHMDPADLAHVAALDDIIRAAFASEPIEHDIHESVGKPLLYDPDSMFEHMRLRPRSEHLERARQLLAQRSPEATDESETPNDPDH